MVCSISASRISDKRRSWALAGSTDQTSIRQRTSRAGQTLRKTRILSGWAIAHHGGKLCRLGGVTASLAVAALILASCVVGGNRGPGVGSLAVAADEPQAALIGRQVLSEG